ncbi:GGDEF domain-containing protein [Mumia sp. zg.B53]|uniref:GGDEF domain-containing protein n=1 Tax=Mumia sp. zg.B53 TaxID=2855449 RepID=UPI001C6F3F41|nr:GGDEF domain-containing protein [Mumia sp. zg.B53]MBW9215995.1 GGDEF domain-containing protein [Mumia sp. zg.B53]
MTSSITSSHAARLTTALGAIRAGDNDSAVAAMKTLLRDLGHDPSELRAAAEYVLVIAAVESGACGQASRAAAACQAVGLALDEPGWVAIGCATRAIAVLQDDRPADAVKDLVRAEYELRDSRRDDLRGWAHTHLGQAYERFGLFELAVPHYEAAMAIEDRLLDLAGSRAIDARNLASVNYHWAKELDMLMEPDLESEVERRRVEVVRWAERSLTLADSEHVGGSVFPLARYLRAAAGWPTDPARWIGELHVCRSNLSEAHVGFEMEATALLAVAYVEVGEIAQAQREARRALIRLDGIDDLNVQRYVRWATLRVADAMGYPSAGAGLGYGRSVSWAWRQQHRSDLEMMRAAIAGYERSRAHDAAVQAAREDALTGLGNRRAFDEWIADAAVSSTEVCVVLVDIDRLKQLNDTYGHAVGDDALKTVGELIRTNTRSEDRAARLGGDEFAIVLSSPDPVEAQLVMDRLQLAARVVSLKPWVEQPGIGLSMGLATCSEGLSSEALYAVADARMYEDKRRRSGAVA